MSRRSRHEAAEWQLQRWQTRVRADQEDADLTAVAQATIHAIRVRGLEQERTLAAIGSTQSLAAVKRAQINERCRARHGRVRYEPGCDGCAEWQQLGLGPIQWFRGA